MIRSCSPSRSDRLNESPTRRKQPTAPKNKQAKRNSRAQKSHLLEAVRLLDRRPNLIDPGHGDELGQLEGRLLYPSLPLQVLALLAPVSWHRDGVAVGLNIGSKTTTRHTHTAGRNVST